MGVYEQGKNFCDRCARQGYYERQLAVDRFGSPRRRTDIFGRRRCRRGYRSRPIGAGSQIILSENARFVSLFSCTTATSTETANFHRYGREVLKNSALTASTRGWSPFEISFGGAPAAPVARVRRTRHL